MNIDSAPVIDDSAGERRTKPRLECAYPVLVRGRDAWDGRFEARAVLRNISASGLYLRTRRHIARGATLLLVIRFSNAPPGQALAPQLAAVAQVLRTEVQPDGAYGIALRFYRHRFI